MMLFAKRPFREGRIEEKANSSASFLKIQTQDCIVSVGRTCEDHRELLILSWASVVYTLCAVIRLFTDSVSRAKLGLPTISSEQKII